MTIQPGSTPGSDMAVERPEADTKVTRIRPSNLKRLICLLAGHTWTNNTTYPTYGYHDTPYPDSYCKRCRHTAA